MRNTILFIIFLCFSVHFAQAQKLKKKTEITGSFKEIYHIDKKTKFRNGENYVINTETGDTLCQGMYKNGFRIGEWIFRDKKSGDKYISYDYSRDSLLYLNSSLAADTFLVQTENGFEVKKVDRPLLYTGFPDELVLALSKNINLPHELAENGTAGISVLQYWVDDKGTISGPKVLTSFLPEFEQKLNTKLMQLPGKFLPAIVNGMPIASSFFVRANINIPDGNLAVKASYIYQINAYFFVTVVKSRVVGVERRVIGTNDYDPRR